MDLGGAGEQLVPAHHSLAKVDFVEPNVGLPDEGLLHKLAAVGNQEQLEIKNGAVTLSALKGSTFKMRKYTELEEKISFTLVSLLV